jgi:GT2 family glycosyltransferase
MNPVLILTRNCLELTKRCVESVLSQDVPTKVCIVDNGSSDGTNEWARSNGYLWSSFNHNAGVSKGWNIGMELLFEDFPRPHILCLNNDVVLPKWFYRTLLSYDAPFVTGVAIDTMPIGEPERMPLQPHPDFSAFLIRRDCWQKVGRFDEEMVIYVQDCDYHVRAHRLGVPLMKANVPFFHVNSQTMKRASPEERQRIQEQANKDRAVFKAKYGCIPGTPQYNALFEDKVNAEAQD